MSYQTITLATRDQALLDRIEAGIAKEAWANETFGATPTGQSVRVNGPAGAVGYFAWPIAIDNEADYAYAVDTGNPDPGGDPGVIGDDEIQAGIQTHWPDPIPEPPLEPTQLPVED